MTPFRLLILSALPLLAGAGPAEDAFEKNVRPALAANCYSCHSAASGKSKGGLRVDSRAALLRGGDSGPAIVPGAPEKSLLIRVLAHGEDQVKMPPKGKLPDAVICELADWVKSGAPWPESSPVAPGNSSASSAAL
jgi:hypothetical protein